MNNLKVSTRLSLVIGLLAALLVAIGGVGLYGIASSNAALKTVYEDRTVPMGQIGEIDSLMLRERLAVTEALALNTPAAVAQAIATVEVSAPKLAKIWTAYMATYLTPEEARLAAVFADEHKAFLTRGLQPAVAAMRAGDVKDTQRLLQEQVRPLHDVASRSLDALMALQVDVAKQEFDAAVARYDTVRWVALLSISAACWPLRRWAGRWYAACRASWGPSPVRCWR